MLAAAERAGIVHVLGTEFRWDPGQATLARVIAAGTIGAPRLATVILDVPVLADADAGVPAWWADAASGGGWLGAHGSQVIVQLLVTLGEFDGVSAALIRGRGPDMSADEGFVVHFRSRSGAIGVMQSTCGDWGSLVVAKRVVGASGTGWIDGLGSKVWVADSNGSHQVPIGDDLPSGPPPATEPLPDGVLHTAYDRMIAHGLDLVPYTRLAETFRDLVLGRPVAANPAPATFADGVAGMAVLDAIRRSAAEHTWVAIEDPFR